MNLLDIGGVGGGLPAQRYLGSETWKLSMEDLLSGDSAGFRLNKQNVISDLSARFWLQTPAFGSSDNLISMFDIGLSEILAPNKPPRHVSLEEVTLILFHQFAIQTSVLTETLAALTPQTATLRRVEFHLLALRNVDDYQPAYISDFINLTILGRAGQPTDRMSASFLLSEPLTQQDQCEIVIEAIGHFALSHGYPSPAAGIENLRSSLANVNRP
jgi:hypothetical protein